jgi:hypothetical protein
MSLTKATYSMIQGAPFNVLDYGADPTGVADSTSAIQAAIQAAINQNRTGTIVFPIGKYKVTDTLTVLYDTGTGAINHGSINMQGFGFGSNLQWSGANNKPIIQYVGTGGKGWYSNTLIEGLHLSVENSATGVTGMLFGDPADLLTPFTGIGNVTIRDNIIYSCDIGIHTWAESDEYTIENNHIRVHQSYGIKNEGGSGYLIQRNHIQDGDLLSYGVYSVGASITIKTNVIQSYTKINAIKLDGVRGFSIMDNYSEGFSASAGNPIFADIVSCKAGYISGNEVGSYVDGKVIKFTTCENITLGPNWHSQSGGFLTALVEIDLGSSGIVFAGRQESSGAMPIIGTPIFNVQNNWLRAIKFTSLDGAQNLTAAGPDTTKTLLTIEPGQAYLIVAQEANFGSTATGMVLANGVATTAEYFEIGKTGGTGISLSVSGLDLQATNNNPTGQLTVGWFAIRLY